MVLDSNQVCGIVDLADEIVSINSINQDSLNQDPTSNIYTNNINLNTSTKHEPSSNEQISNNQIKAKLKELNIGSHLSSKQQRELFKVIIKHKNAFAWNDNEIGLFINNLFTTSNQSVFNQHSTKLSNGTCSNGSFNSNAKNQVTSDMEAIHSVNTIQIEYNQPNWVVEQKLDSDLNQIINLIKAKQIVFANKSFNSIINQLEISNSDILIKNSNGKRLICVPKHKVLEILNTHHDYQLSGHLGCSKTTQRIKETYY